MGKMSYMHNKSTWWVKVLSSKRRQGWCVATNHNKNTIAHLHNKKKNLGEEEMVQWWCVTKGHEKSTMMHALVQQNNIWGKGNGDTKWRRAMRMPPTYAIGEHDAQAIVKVSRLWNAPPQSTPHIWATKQHKRKKRDKRPPWQCKTKEH
jgi:hypothetical protein